MKDKWTNWLLSSSDNKVAGIQCPQIIGVCKCNSTLPCRLSLHVVPLDVWMGQTGLARRHRTWGVIDARSQRLDPGRNKQHLNKYKYGIMKIQIILVVHRHNMSFAIIKLKRYWYLWVLKLWYFCHSLPFCVVTFKAKLLLVGSCCGPRLHVQQISPFPWQGGHQCSL